MTMTLPSWLLITLSFVSHCSHATTLKKVLLPDAVKKGAVCLDGSPSGYYIHNGITAPNKWIIHLQGGGWCSNEAECFLRFESTLGSSNQWPDTYSYSGLLSDNCTINPYFCGWSMVFVAYCDGASFAGNVDSPVVWNGVTMYFRGFRILNTVIDEILAVGGENIEEIIFTGCSAGGLATYLHADFVRSKIPSKIPVHAIADAGYFINAPNVKGKMHIQGIYQDVFKMHNCTGGVNQDCIAAYPGEEWKCYMAQYTYPFIQTPMFSLNARYDTWQLYNILQIRCFVPDCSKRTMKEFENFGEELLEAISPAINSSHNGVFIDSCNRHCQSLNSTSWSTTTVGNQTPWETFYHWYFIDAPNTNGEMHIRGVYQNVFEMHNCTGGVNQDCIAANPGEEWKCYMAQYTYPYIKTPIFSLNSRYDTWQLYNVLQIRCFVPYCTQRQMNHVRNFGEEFLEAASPAIQSPLNGVFIDSCNIHCQSLQADSWSKTIVGNQTMWETFYSWLTKNSTSYSSKEVEQCTYPCNPTCSHNWALSLN